MLFLTLAFLAIGLTVTMFVTKQAMLGFACAIFWFIFGAYCYTLSATPWGDIYYYLFFASSVGMTIFTAFAAFGLREKRDALGDEGDEGGMSENENNNKTSDLPKDNENDSGTGQTSNNEELFYGERPRPSVRTQKLRDRAKARRTGT